MDLRDKLTQRFGVREVKAIVAEVNNDDTLKRELYTLLYDTDETVAYQAAWVLTHLRKQENPWLRDRQDEMIDEAMTCAHTGKRRLLMTLINRFPLAVPLRTDFLDYCLGRINTLMEPPAIRSLSIKLAYEMCRHYPELLEELRLTLDMLEPRQQPPSIRSVRRHVNK